MAKNKISQWSQNRTSNTDVGGIGLTDSDSAGNLRDAIQEMMKQVSDTNAGDSPLDDTFTIMNATDNTKEVAISAENVAPGTKRTLDGEKLYRGGAPLTTIYTASGTHTLNPATIYFQIEAVGGGGGGGGVDGQGAGSAAAASGGGSGFYGKTGLILASTITPDIDGNRVGTVTIGAAGAASGASASNGGNGTFTRWADGANLTFWGGGRGGVGVAAETTTHGVAEPPDPATTSGVAVYGSAQHNTCGIVTEASAGPIAKNAYGGIGAGSAFGTGGQGGYQAEAGSVGTGYGAGGGGAAVREVSTNYAGGAGTAGLLIVMEW